MADLPRDIKLGNELLYDAVAIGMIGYTRSAFRVQVLGGDGDRFQPGLMLIGTHRAESDVPLLCGALYHRYAVWRHRMPRLHFAARDDLFEPGFFAGFPPGLPLAARQLLYPIDIGNWLPEVRVHPVRDIGVIRLAQALAALPAGTLLAGLLPEGAAERLAERARRVGLPAPATANEALRGEFADLLWTSHRPDQLSNPAFEPVWRARAAAGTTDLRDLVEFVRDGKILLVFPEGRPSPDGAIGPVRRGIGALIRRGRPDLVQPIGLAYDPLTRSRPRAYVALPPRRLPPSGDVEAATLELLRLAMPLTVGQVVAGAVRGAAAAGRASLAPRELDAALAAELVAARGAGRLADPALATVAGRRERLDDAIGACVSRGLLQARGRRELGIADSAVDDPVLRRLALEHASARELVTASLPGAAAVDG